jgi:hypothetical protein
LNHFGAFFRINEIIMSPFEEEMESQDIFKNEYLDLVYYLQAAIEEGVAKVDGNQYTFEDFCFRPITGEGCLVTSPMDFWKMDQLKMMNDKDVKFTAQCIPSGEESDGRICFDRIGVPV